MNRFLILIIFASTLITAQDSTSTENKLATLVVNFIGFESNDGMLLAALSDSRELYEIRGKSLQSLSSKINDLKSVCVFDSLAYGEYAIKAFHDEDDDGKMTTNFIGLPSEDYGFSNNATGSLGPADWDYAKFTINKPKIEITITID